jgi:hypothetical protein
MKAVSVIFAVAYTGSVLAGCSRDASTVTGASGGSDVSACVDRGVKYFKGIGSYPTLSSPPNAGRSAEDVATERCNRTTTAF